ncbi:MAG: ABC transporter substrate-binding protein [Candidatus Tectomicrobia bacterium]|nr:ABC transporter substrate-binding protein [Candidatus Tectomicrobia bacterium]
MNGVQRRWLGMSWLVTLLLIVGVLAAATTAAAKLAGKEVKLGALIPTTGAVAHNGLQQVIAMNMAMEEINAAGGVGGLPLRIIMYDTASKSETSIQAARKLIDADKVLAVLGPYLSSTTAVTFPVANRAAAPIISSSAAAPGLSASNRPWSFRNVMTSEKLNGPVVEKWLKAYPQIKRVAVATDVKDFFSKTYGKDVMPALLKANGVEVGLETDFVTTDIDFSAQVTKVKHAKVDGVVLAGLQAASANFLREMRRQGVMVPAIGGVSLSVPEFVHLAKKDAEGVYTVGSFWAENPDPKVRRFVAEYIKRDKKGDKPMNTTANLYDTIFVTKTCIETSGVTNRPEDLASDRQKIRDCWANLKDYTGVGGRTAMGLDGDAVKEAFIFVVKDGDYVRLP